MIAGGTAVGSAASGDRRVSFTNVGFYCVASNPGALHMLTCGENKKDAFNAYGTSDTTQGLELAVFPTEIVVNVTHAGRKGNVFHRIFPRYRQP
jgi:hypothetical protein